MRWGMARMTHNLALLRQTGSDGRAEYLLAGGAFTTHTHTDLLYE